MELWTQTDRLKGVDILQIPEASLSLLSLKKRQSAVYILHTFEEPHYFIPKLETVRVQSPDSQILKESYFSVLRFLILDTFSLIQEK